MSEKTKGSGVVTRSIRIDPDLYMQLSYWAKKKNISIAQYINDAVELAIKMENKDYDLPALEIQRLNQMQDIVLGLAKDVQNMTDVTISGFTSLLGLCRGDSNYLYEGDEET